MLGFFLFYWYIFLLLFHFKVLNGDKREKRESTITFCMIRASRVRGTPSGQQSSQIRIKISWYLMESRRQQRGIGLTSLETLHSSVTSPWKRLCCYLRSTQLSKGLSIVLYCPKTAIQRTGLQISSIRISRTADSQNYWVRTCILTRSQFIHMYIQV